MGVADPDSTGRNHSRGSPKAIAGSMPRVLTPDKVDPEDRTVGRVAGRDVPEVPARTASAVPAP